MTQLLAAIFLQKIFAQLTKKRKTGPNAIYCDYSDAFEPDRLFIG